MKETLGTKGYRHFQLLLLFLEKERRYQYVVFLSCARLKQKCHNKRREDEFKLPKQIKKGFEQRWPFSVCIPLGALKFKYAAVAKFH